MKIALAGKPGCGRSTLFRALAGSTEADTGKPLTVDVPDERLDFLTDVHRPEKKTHARVVFTDVPSPVLAPRNLGLLRTAAVLALVLDNYALGDVTRDLQEIESEMILADMALCEKRLARLTKEGAGGSREATLLSRLIEHMEQGHPLRVLELDQGHLDTITPYALLSLKPLMVISNRMGEPVTPEDLLEEMVGQHGGTLLRIDAGFELELTEIEEEERLPFLESMGYSSSGLARLVRTAYEALDLIVFFTVGSDEVRAWPVRKGSSALEAAGVIHSDMARGFIRAVVAQYDLYHDTPDRTALRDQGLLGVEGKDYTVRDGDILEIRFCV
jgi:ribosome-binding ATPase YchF (GTP1/OBG family)